MYCILVLHFAVHFKQLIRLKASLATICAAAIQEELVSRHTEAAWKLPLDFQTTPFHLKDFAAIIAVEMMMMLFAGNLVTGRLPGDFHGHQPLIVNQGSNVAINRSDADSFNELLSIVKSLFRRKRPASKEKR